jgi:hypothetical protein
MAEASRNQEGIIGGKDKMPSVLEQLAKERVERKQTQTDISEKAVAKWERFGLLEGLKTKDEKVRMARLLENQASYLLEASDTTDIKGFQAVAFPMVRRVFGSLLAQEITSVQPMALPSGLVFWLDFTMGTAKAGTGNDTWTAGGSVYGNPLAPLTGGAAGTGGHYDLHQSYTQREVTGSVGIQSSASVAWSDVDFDPALSAAVALGQLFKVAVDLDEDAALTNVDVTNFKDFAISGAFTSIVNAYYRRHNAFDRSSNVLTVVYSGSQRLNSGSAAKVSVVRKDALSADSGGSLVTPAWEYAFDSSDIIPEIDIKIVSHPVTANSRKLKVRWTPEVAQDLNAYHTLDAESELTQIMADQVALDIDTEILVDLVNNARAAKYFWDARPGFFVNKETGAPLANTSFTGNVADWYQTLMITITDVSNVIMRKNSRSAANFLVVSPEVATILESLSTFRPAMDMADTTVQQFSMGIEKFGTLANRFTVYKVPRFLRNVILVGYKGSDWLSTGYVYGPYVPLIVTPTIVDPTNFTPSKAVMTRYSKQIVQGHFYGLVVVKGMETL